MNRAQAGYLGGMATKGEAVKREMQEAVHRRGKTVMIEGLAFDPETHRYTFEGKPLPAVTKVLQILERRSAPLELLEFAGERGRAVHEACELDDRNDLDEATVDPIIRPYLEAWRSFKRGVGYEPVEIELAVANGRYGYAGTLDRVAVVNGKAAVLDIKTGSAVPLYAGPQLAAYQEAYAWVVGAALVKRPAQLPTRRYAVWLRDDGRFHLIKYDSPEDWGVFRSALNIWQWMEKNAG